MLASGKTIRERFRPCADPWGAGAFYLAVFSF
jgi:hypothetical protein